jgi:hypothetical protein
MNDEKLRTLLILNQRWPKSVIDYNVVGDRVEVIDPQRKVLTVLSTTELEKMKLEDQRGLDTMRKQTLALQSSMTMTTARKVQFVLRWAVGITVNFVALYYTRSALISLILASVAFYLTKFVLGLWTTPADELYDAMRSGKPERIEAANALCSAAERGDKEGMKAATDALARAIREGK